MTEILCRRDNYGGLRTQEPSYIVVHYTAGRNDTAQNNGRYFAANRVGASAHYFVDENEVVCSVPERFVAWHCGGSSYRHPGCRNGNSIGVEICSKIENGQYFFAPQAVERAKELVRLLMEKYGIARDCVLRHYDVTGKCCPAPFVGDGQPAWEEFLGGLQMYKTLQDVPSWAASTVAKLVERGLLEGDGKELNLSHDLVRTLVILDRAGVLDKEEHYGNKTQCSR